MLRSAITIVDTGRVVDGGTNATAVHNREAIRVEILYVKRQKPRDCKKERMMMKWTYMISVTNAEVYTKIFVQAHLNMYAAYNSVQVALAS